MLQKIWLQPWKLNYSRKKLTSKKGNPSNIFCCLTMPVGKEEENAGGGKTENASNNAQKC